MIYIEDETRYCGYNCIGLVVATWIRKRSSGDLYYYCDKCKQLRLTDGVNPNEFEAL